MRFIALTAFIAVSVAGAASAAAPRELGAVRWGRNLDAALTNAARSRKPVLVLFQEIPGCARCVGFGQGPLSHPLLVEAIETLFEPVAIHNNRPGPDAAVLARFHEPAWNNPVLRVVDATGRDIVPRNGDVVTTGQVAAHLATALRAAGRDVPRWLDGVIEEAGAIGARAIFEVRCFWEGEARFGAVPGVLATRAGFVGGREAVEVRYDPAHAPLASLVREADAAGCARRVHVDGEVARREAAAVVGARAMRQAEALIEAPPSDQKHDLRATPYRWLPLTPLQATRVNGALARGDDPGEWLSPRQRELLSAIQATLARAPDAFDDLEPPARVEALDGYSRELSARLARVRG